MKLIKKILINICKLSTFSAIIIAVFLLYLNYQLPDIKQLSEIQLQVPVRIISSDGKLIAEYGDKRRIPVTIDEIPGTLINAIVATEDRRFYKHVGVDLIGLTRAFVDLVSSGRKNQGGSTITMQVARNFFLSREKTYLRKINEILLALKIERELPKKKILELYLNKIYFGKRAYGVQAAAQTYYGSTIDKLTIAQQAMLAGLPKAPSAKNPINNPIAAKKRRNFVLKKMLENKMINNETYKQATNEPVEASYHARKIELESYYLAEMVKKEIEKMYGSKVYTSGMEIYTTIDSRLQEKANEILARHVIDYTTRYKYQGPIDNIQVDKYENDDLIEKLLEYPSKPLLEVSVITEINKDNNTISVLKSSGEIIEINYSNLSWAISSKSAKAEKNISSILNIGDVIYIYRKKDNNYKLAQAPEVEAAIVSLSPKNGAILSLVGGYDYKKSNFNRASQARRQPGSAFKPIIYTAALDQGFTAASIFNDAPFVQEDKSLAELWRPQNYTKKFYGPTRLRAGLVLSRNLVSIRILEALNIDKTINLIHNFGFNTNQRTLSLALGTLLSSPLELATAFSCFSNGGRKVEPYLIEKIYNSNKEKIYSKEKNFTQKVISPQVAYIMHNILQDVIQNGTGRKAKALNRKDIAGKTGSTNNYLDASFVGYNPDLITATWFGYDEPKSLYEYGSTTALPLWVDFMKFALKDKPEKIVPQPPGIVAVKIDPKNGLLARQGQKNTIFEIFTTETVPKTISPRTLNNMPDTNSNEAVSQPSNSLF